MATIRLPNDFKDFLRLLNSRGVEYLVVGGYAVGYHGYARATADIAIWIAAHPINAKRIVEVLREFFGSPLEGATVDLFQQPDKVVRLGFPPVRIEILTSIDGVAFDECYAGRVVDEMDGVQVSLINFQHLKINKKASGRLKDLTDLERPT